MNGDTQRMQLGFNDIEEEKNASKNAADLKVKDHNQSVSNTVQRTEVGGEGTHK
jgi:hypothetical protein